MRGCGEEAERRRRREAREDEERRGLVERALRATQTVQLVRSVCFSLLRSALLLGIPHLLEDLLGRTHPWHRRRVFLKRPGRENHVSSVLRLDLVGHRDAI